MPEISGVTPPYLQIAAYYRDQIRKGELRPGDRFPTARAVAEAFGVSRATTDKALSLLRTEQLIRSVPGIGSEVTAACGPMSSGGDRLNRARRTGSIHRPGEKSSGHQAEIIPAPADVAAALGIEAGSPVIRRCRVFSDVSGIVAHSTSWIRADIGEAVPELLVNEPMPRLWHDLYEERTGRRVASRRDDVEARIATPMDLELLGVEEQDASFAIVVLLAHFADDQGVPVEYGVDLGAPGRGIRGTPQEITA